MRSIVAYLRRMFNPSAWASELTHEPALMVIWVLATVMIVHILAITLEHLPEWRDNQTMIMWPW